MTHFEFKVAFYVSELCKLKLTKIMVYTNKLQSQNDTRATDG